MDQHPLAWPCPSCQNTVEGTGATSRPGFGDSGLPVRQHTTCPICSIGLVRTPDLEDCAWKVDDRLGTVVAIERELQLVANRNGLEFTVPAESSSGLWRFALSQPNDNPRDPTVSPVTGAGRTPYLAMREALVAAEEKALY